jgi:hypothetical protein
MRLVLDVYKLSHYDLNNFLGKLIDLTTNPKTLAEILQRLADILNAKGHTIKHGKPFHVMQVKRILDRRSLYEGRYSMQG